MAAKKAELLAEAKKLKLEVTDKNTIAEIQAAIEGAGDGADKEVHQDTNEADSQESTEVAEATAEPKVAKAGKRSAKGIAETEAKIEKIEKQHHRDEQEASEAAATPRPAQKPARPKIERAGKKLREAAKAVEAGKEYSLKDALELATKTTTTKFDSTVELHVRLGVDPRQADQNIRENIVLPAGTGKTVKIAVFGEADDVAAAKKAGADVAGAEEFLQQLDKGIINFDVLIATPTVMPKLGKYARALGPKGLMPNPKSGTVTKDVAKAIEQARAGKVEMRVDETGIVHLGIGKVSFGSEKLMQNAQTVLSALKSAKPGSLKGNYVISIYTTTTMGPSIRIAASEM